MGVVNADRFTTRLSQRRTQGGNCAASLHLDSVNNKVQLIAGRHARRQQVEADLGVVQKHFGGVSRSEALRLSLALTANAIREGRMNVVG